MARSKKPPTEKPEQAADENVTEAAEEVRQETGQDEAESEPVELAEPKPPAAEPEPGPDDLQATTWPDHNDAVAATTPVQPRRGGMLGPVLGGVLAAGLGFGLSQYLGPVSGLPALDRLTSDLASQKADIGQLRADLANLASEAPDGSGIDPAAVAALQDSTARIEEDLQRLTALATAADTRAGELEQRLAAVEKRPAAGDGAGDGASAAYEGEVQALRDDLAAQRAASETVAAQVQTLASDIQARIDASEAAAKAGVQRAALNRLRAAMDSGGDLMPALVELRDSGAEIPAALEAAAQSGVASLPDLQRRFPQAARAALSATVKVSQDDGVWGRVGAFLRSQTGARSLTPREGDDPDAILSRAEAALAGGDLDKALGELSALPEDAAAAMAEWSGAASFRLDATRAADELNMALNG